MSVKYAIVTGAASGMGRCYAIQLAQMGYGVLLVDINEPAAQELSVQLSQHLLCVRCVAKSTTVWL